MKTFTRVKYTEEVIVCIAFGDSLCSSLALRLTTVSLDNTIENTLFHSEQIGAAGAYFFIWKVAYKR